MKIKTKIFLLFLLTLLLTGGAYMLVVFPILVADEAVMATGSLNNQVDELDRVIEKYRDVTQDQMNAIIAKYGLDDHETMEDQDQVAILKEILSMNPQVLSVKLLSMENGSVSVSQTGEVNYLNYADAIGEEWFVDAAKKPGDTVFSGIEMAEGSDDLIQHVTKVISDSEDASLGAVSFEMNIGLLKEFFRSMNFKDIGIYVMYTPTGSLMIEQGQPLRFEKQDILGQEFDHSNDGDVGFGVDLEKGQGLGEITYNGKTYYVAARESAAMPCTYYFMIDHEGIKKLVMHKVVPVLWISGAMTFMSLLVLLVLVQWLVNKPLVKFSRITAYIADTGDLSQVLDVRRKDEIGLMAKSFNTMVAELKNNKDNMESIVQERTRELRKLTVAIEQSPSEIIITDLEGRLEYANKAAVTARGFALRN